MFVSSLPQLPSMEFQLLQEVQIPEPISLNRFKTLNGFGFIFLTPSPMIIDFIENEAHPGAVTHGNWSWLRQYPY